MRKPSILRRVSESKREVVLPLIEIEEGANQINAMDDEEEMTWRVFLNNHASADMTALVVSIKTRIQCVLSDVFRPL